MITFLGGVLVGAVVVALLESLRQVPPAPPAPPAEPEPWPCWVFGCTEPGHTHLRGSR